MITEEKKEISAQQDFVLRCADMFSNVDSGRLGGDMYCDHAGVRLHELPNGEVFRQAMSGVLTWTRYAEQGTLPKSSSQSLLSMLPDLSDVLETGIPIVEYGPGSMVDGERLIKTTKSSQYIPVDISEGIIEQARHLAIKVPNCEISPAVMDLFSVDNKPLISSPALAVFLGGTIANLPGPIPDELPTTKLTALFLNLSKPIGLAGGYLLVTGHAEQNGRRNIELYNEKWHQDFGVNFLYRLHAESNLIGFDPRLFQYIPQWHGKCNLLAHTVQATEEQLVTFPSVNGRRVRIRKGETYHCNNSFKYTPAVVEKCASQAKLSLIAKWHGLENNVIYLFKVPPHVSLAPLPRNNATLHKLQTS